MIAHVNARDLRTLNLSRGALSVLPDGFVRCTSVARVSLAYNRLDDAALAAAFGGVGENNDAEQSTTCADRKAGMSALMATATATPVLWSSSLVSLPASQQRGGAAGAASANAVPPVPASTHSSTATSIMPVSVNRVSGAFSHYFAASSSSSS